LLEPVAQFRRLARKRLGARVVAERARKRRRGKLRRIDVALNLA